MHFYNIHIYFFNLFEYYTGTFQNGNGVRFYLPEFELFFEPQPGDVMLISASDIWHCTRTTGHPGQFGVALFLHVSVLQSWRTVMEDVEKIKTGVKLDPKKLAKATKWLDSNLEYQAIIHG